MTAQFVLAHSFVYTWLFAGIRFPPPPHSQFNAINSAFPLPSIAVIHGCTASNLNDLPAVALCRQRCAFLDETIRHSHALSAAHLSYINSPHSIALSLIQLHRFPAPSLPPHNDDHDLPLPPPNLKCEDLVLARMWKPMLECHRIQCEAMREAGILRWMGSKKKTGIADEATKLLEQEVINWTLQFSSWIGAQKRYVRALNHWLLKCLLYESKETADGVGAFSPGRMGAPRVFIICSRWSQAMERISEKEVVERMYVFGRRVLQIWGQQRLEIMLERKVGRNVVKGDEQKLQKQIREVKKKMVAAFTEVNSLSHSEDIIYDAEDKGGSTSLQASLQQIFEAMESFAGISARLDEELLQASDMEERGGAEHTNAC